MDSKQVGALHWPHVCLRNLVRFDGKSFSLRTNVCAISRLRRVLNIEPLSHSLLPVLLPEGQTVVIALSTIVFNVVQLLRFLFARLMQCLLFPHAIPLAILTHSKILSCFYAMHK